MYGPPVKPLLELFGITKVFRCKFLAVIKSYTFPKRDIPLQDNSPPGFILYCFLHIPQLAKQNCSLIISLKI